MIAVRGWAVKETEKAVLFVPAGQMGRPVWLPKSQVTVSIGEWDDVLTLPAWLAASNNIKALPPARRGHL